MFLKYFVSDFEFKNKKNFFHYCVYQFEICNTNHSVNIDYVNTTEEGVLKCPKWHTEMPGDIFIVMIGGGGVLLASGGEDWNGIKHHNAEYCPHSKELPSPNCPQCRGWDDPWTKQKCALSDK